MESQRQLRADPVSLNSLHSTELWPRTPISIATSLNQSKTLRTIPLPSIPKNVSTHRKDPQKWSALPYVSAAALLNQPLSLLAESSPLPSELPPLPSEPSPLWLSELPGNPAAFAEGVTLLRQSISIFRREISAIGKLIEKLQECQPPVFVCFKHAKGGICVFS